MKVPFRIIWWAVLVLVLLPMAWLIYNALTGGLGANPIEAINRYLGDWALRFLLIALALTPIRILNKKAWPIRLRRMLGLTAFFYAFAHLSSYVMIDQFFDWAAIWQDIVKRRFITVGMVAVLILLALAITSPPSIAKRLGARNWKRLHKLVYLAGALGCLHFFWMVKADIREPVIYGIIFSILMIIRLIESRRKKLVLGDGQ